MKYQTWSKKKFYGVLVIIFFLGMVLSPKGTETAQNNSNSNSAGTTPSGTNNNSNAQAPTQNKAKEWVKVFEASGTANKKTDSFALLGGKQRIKYTFNGGDFIVGSIYIMKEGTSKEDQGGIPEVMISKAGSDETILRKSAGTYYLDMAAANTSWTVTIEEER